MTDLHINGFLAFAGMTEHYWNGGIYWNDGIYRMSWFDWIPACAGMTCLSPGSAGRRGREGRCAEASASRQEETGMTRIPLVRGGGCYLKKSSKTQR